MEKNNYINESEHLTSDDKFLLKHTHTNIPDNMLLNLNCHIPSYMTLRDLEIYKNAYTKEVTIIVNGIYNIDGYSPMIMYFHFLNESLYRLHRVNEPAIELYQGEMKLMESYYHNGIQYRLNAPQKIKYFSSGEVSEIHYIENDIYHRIDGPAKTIFKYNYFDKKLKADEFWYVKGVLHRLNGPASTFHLMNYTHKSWFVNGKEIPENLLPIFENGQLANKVKLTKESILEAMFFDQEYGTFLKTKYDEMSSNNKK